jgi:hypothetical protein
MDEKYLKYNSFVRNLWQEPFDNPRVVYLLQWKRQGFI